MRYVKWTFLALILLICGSFIHYTLPQHDIVRIVNTYEERQTLKGWTTIFWSGSDANVVDGVQTRDVQFIQTVTADGEPMVYRNEDTGWGWPPYFKFDTASLYTEANDAVSSKAEPEWYAMRHYGWRSELMSIFPNAIGLKAVSGPDAKVTPWANIIILTFLAIMILLLSRMWIQFRERTIDPMMENAEDAWDAVDSKTDALSDGARNKFFDIKDWFSNLRR